jgi:UDP-3-O-[3-hydroxymyristoyl] N-acetylglucosamine deacetylase
MDGVADAMAWNGSPGTGTARAACLAEMDHAALVTSTSAFARQHTLASLIGCSGVALHSGQMARLTLHPAAADTGIVFVRSDLAGAAVAARHDRVVDTRLCTVIRDGAARVGTIEHLMAACVGAGIDNARVEVDGPELPILDGSAEEFVFLIDCAGKTAQDSPRRVIEVLRPVRVQKDDAWAELRPLGNAGAPGLDMELTIEFAAGAIGRQSCALRLTEDSFRRELATARTFAQAAEIAELRAAGLALGGSLDNAVVVDGDAVLNPGGLRMRTEFVRHKLLDAVGDLALTGRALHGRFSGYRTGHTLNNRLLRALFAEPSNWRLRLDNAGAAGWLSAA